jgi:hypothetical protein
LYLQTATDLRLTLVFSRVLLLLLLKLGQARELLQDAFAHVPRKVEHSPCLNLLLELLLVFFDLADARDLALLAGEVVVDHGLGHLGICLLLRQRFELIGGVFVVLFGLRLVLRRRLDLSIQFKLLLRVPWRFVVLLPHILTR